MSESYTVSEAADILGIASERIWELVARGVLAGESQADGSYRVRLKPDPAPVAEASTSHARPPNGNGNGDPTFEWRAFRELLTEFRTLTERYGQALLALGEARGEVAALRGRVEQLETRMEVRPPASGVAAWQASRPDEEDLPLTEAEAEAEAEPEVEAQPEPVVTEADVEAEPSPAVEAEPEPVTVEADVAFEPEPAYADLAAEPEGPDLSELEAEADAVPPEAEAEERPTAARASFAIANDDLAVEAVEASDEQWSVEEPGPEPTAEGSQERQRVIRRHRLAATLRRRHRARTAAIAGFAEALARAEDPTTQLLPASEVTGEILEIEAPEGHDEDAAATAAAEETTAREEPWVPPSAEAEELELEMGGWQAPPHAERAPEPGSLPEAEPRSEAESLPEPEPRPEPETLAVARDESELRAYMSASVPDDVDPIEWVERILSPSISRSPEAALSEERAEDAVIDEPFVAAATPEDAPSEEAAVEGASAEEQVAEREAPVELPEHEPDELHEPPPARPLSQLPGIADLEAALEELRRSSQSSYSHPQGTGAEEEASQPEEYSPHDPPQHESPWQGASAEDAPYPADQPAAEASSESSAVAEDEPATLPPYRASALLLDDAEFRRRLLEPDDSDWLRGRRGPAASAYRRLRRIFPG